MVEQRTHNPRDRGSSPCVPSMIAVHLCNPKVPHNVGGAIRACAIFGASRLTWDGDRVLDERHVVGATTCSKRKWRLPREERMKAYEVNWGMSEDGLLRAVREGMTPVCVEIVRSAELLPTFNHPENAVYVFGPEDGTIGRFEREACHRFVRIPSKHCLNLAAAVNVVLYDRLAKAMKLRVDDLEMLAS